MIEIILVVIEVIFALNLCIVVHCLVKYVNEFIEKKHEENRIADHIFSKCQKLGEQEEEMLGKRGIVNVLEFNKLDAKIDVLLELLEEINKEEEEV